MRNDSGISFNSLHEEDEARFVWQQIINSLPQHLLLRLGSKRLAVVLADMHLSRSVLEEILNCIAADERIGDVFNSVFPNPDTYDHETQFEKTLENYIIQNYFNQIEK